MTRIFNFSAGPAVMPVEVLEEARAQLVEYQGTGMSLMESSHRDKPYESVHMEAQANLRTLLGVGDDYEVLFLQGGASHQFAMLPMNFLGTGQSADYTHTGVWAAKAIKEAQLVGQVKVIADTSKDQPCRMPAPKTVRATPGAAYVHITSNETIAGSQWKAWPTVDAPLVADMSSDILSRPVDATKFSLIYAGAQKNLGPSGVTMVVARKEFLAKGSTKIPAILRYTTHAEEKSLYNTPPCFSVYLLCLTTRWLQKAGLPNVFERNRRKAGLIYQVIDGSGFYKGTAAKENRSDMNVTFRLQSEDLEKKFLQGAAERKMSGLKGHRSVGGIRASIYNAFPEEGVKALVDYMKDFEAKNG